MSLKNCACFSKEDASYPAASSAAALSFRESFFISFLKCLSWPLMVAKRLHDPTQTADSQTLSRPSATNWEVVWAGAQNPTTYKNWRDGFFTFCLKMILPGIWLWQLQELVFAQKFWGAQGLNSKIARHSLFIHSAPKSLTQKWPADSCWDRGVFLFFFAT